MNERDPEERFLRNMAILASAAAVTGLLAVATLITVLVSANFNVLNWME